MAVSPGGRPADASPIGTPGGRQNWVDKAGGLPRYIRMVAHALIKRGHTPSSAIAIAVQQMRKWATGEGNVSPQVRAAAAGALAEWEAKRGAAHARTATNLAVASAQSIDLAVPITSAGDGTRFVSATGRKKATVKTKKPKLGSGKRFQALKAELARRGAKNPDALAAYIGRKRYGAKKMAGFAAKKRKASS